MKKSDNYGTSYKCATAFVEYQKITKSMTRAVIVY